MTEIKFFTALLFVFIAVNSEYIPPGPLYRCPKEKLLLHPCSCDTETDIGIYVSCNNTNLASMSVALNNLATFRLPIEKLTIYRCHFARLFGSLLYKLQLRTLYILDTPVETIDEHTFLGVNTTLNELHLINSQLNEFPASAFRILGNLSILNIDGHRLSVLPKDAFAPGEIAGRLLRLYLPNGQLSTPPIEALQPLRRLKTVDLHNNQIKELKRNQFKGLRDVEILDLSTNLIPKVDSSHIADLTKLAWFNISNNDIKEITRGAFARNTVLRVLNMTHNKIRRLDSTTFRGMRFLRRLYLSDNSISDIGRGTFGSLSKIGTIGLARNAITKLDYQIFYELKFIDTIDVSENNLTEIQKLAFKDIYLTDINLSKNQINKIESGAFVNCANITKLDLSFNKITSIPKRAFDETTYATELQLAHNSFTVLNQIPLHNMTGLKILNVSYNGITNIPKGTFPKLYELHTIDLSHNNLTDIFNSVFQTLLSLRSLNMSYNDLEVIKPSTFGSLPTLLKLDLSYNKLRDIAKSAFTRLASTRELILRANALEKMFILPISVSHLDLSYNHFQELPPKLWPSMNSLLHFDISHNYLQDNLVLGSFTNLLTLQRLNLNYNQIKNPPWAALSELTSLQYLYLMGNNITKLNRGAFGRLPVVFELNLANNNINNVTSLAFEGLLQLLVLNLTNNNISHIPNGAFQGMVALQKLDLSYNKIEKLDNKTNSLFEDCLSLERLNLSHNRISFITRKTFPSNPYVPYKLKEIDLSYNSMPVITYDIVYGTTKLEKLNLSYNSISDLRKGVIGNLTNLHVLDLSNNKLHDLTTDKDFLKLPKQFEKLYLANNVLSDLPWDNLANVTKLYVLDINGNNFDTINEKLMKMITKGTTVHIEDNPLTCDCFLRPLKRYFDSRLDLSDSYKMITCQNPPYLSNRTLFQLTEDRLNCPTNVNISRIKESQPGDYEVTPDLRFRELTLKQDKLKVKWRVMRNEDIADTYLVIRDAGNVLYETTLPYFQRTFDVELKDKLKERSNGSEYQICLLSKDSRTSVRGFNQEQCRFLSTSFGTERLCTEWIIVTFLLLLRLF